MSVNKVILVGHLGRDPEVRSTASGQSVCNFSLATTERFTGRDGQSRENTEWHNVVVWGKPADACGRYLKKGGKQCAVKALSEMGGGPPESACRSGFQTTTSCEGKEPWW
jgi:single stranded DNA-binding protein